MSALLGIMGGMAGIFGSIFGMLVSVGQTIARVLADMVRWFFNLMVEKPEAGLTLLTLSIYLMT